MEVRARGNPRGIFWMMLNFLDVLLIFVITFHWAFATGGFLAMKTNWSIPRFILICLMMRYFLMSYGY